MKVIATRPLAYGRRGDTVFLTLYEREYEHNGRRRTYFMIGRGERLEEHDQKFPDAVVIVAILNNPNERKRLVMVSEFRIPLGTREIGFPAGLIDPSDFNAALSEFASAHPEGDKCLDSETYNRTIATAAAYKAAIREMKEETGLDFVPQSASPPNLYSSAGLTNESIIYVFGTATGTPSNQFLEKNEDIEVKLYEEAELSIICDAMLPNVGHSKTAWPFMWSFGKHGLPDGF